jgi:hypothetical protein
LADLDHLYPENEPTLDYVTADSEIVVGAGVENRAIPLIPFDELMLIETLGVDESVLFTVLRGNVLVLRWHVFNGHRNSRYGRYYDS